MLTSLFLKHIDRWLLQFTTYERAFYFIDRVFLLLKLENPRKYLMQDILLDNQETNLFTYL